MLASSLAFALRAWLFNATVSAALKLPFDLSFPQEDVRSVKQISEKGSKRRRFDYFFQVGISLPKIVASD